MSRFSGAERVLAAGVRRVPWLREQAKLLYQGANWLFWGEKGFERELHPKVKEVCCVGGSGVHTFFGYFDKSPWNSNTSELLCHRVAGGEAVVGVVGEGGEVKAIGRTSVWSWQQGAMLQWSSNGGGREVVYNSLSKDVLGSCWIDLSSSNSEFVPFPVQSIDPSGRYFASVNYSRLRKTSPDYGYRATVSNFAPDLGLDKDGLWVVDRASGRAELAVSLERVRDVATEPDMLDAEHEVNHAVFSPSGRFLAFLHRWNGRKGRKTRLYVLELSTNKIRLVMSDGFVSHYCWNAESELVVYGRVRGGGEAYFIVSAVSGEAEALLKGVLDRWGDGHPALSPNGRYLVVDSYPDRRRQQHLLLCDMDKRNAFEIGRFFSPVKCSGLERVDLHPRWSPSGMEICLDVSYSGFRQMLVLDISAIVV